MSRHSILLASVLTAAFGVLAAFPSEATKAGPTHNPGPKPTHNPGPKPTHNPGPKPTHNPGHPGMNPPHDPGSHGTKPGKADHDDRKPGKNGHSHGKWKPGRVITVNGRQVVVDDNGDPMEGGPTVQGVRYLRVKNESGHKLRVFVTFNAANAGEEEAWQGKPLVYEFEAGEEALLSSEDGAFAGSTVRIWAESGELRWDGYKERDLVLVTQPYAADDIGTFTFTFNP
jgi:hypothetical protein